MNTTKDDIKTIRDGLRIGISEYETLKGENEKLRTLLAKARVALSFYEQLGTTGYTSENLIKKIDDSKLLSET